MHIQLEQAIEQISTIANQFGLDPFPMQYELCPASIIRTFASYGMPTRYTHWSFGKAYHRLKLNEQLGLGKIYELVINHNPCYAFLLDTNSLLQNKLIIAHVLAHSDFFRHNHHFSTTNRQMMETMTQAAIRLQHYEDRYGMNEVESWIDAAHALQMHTNILRFIIKHNRQLPEWKIDILQIIIEEMDYFRPQMETKIANEGWATYWHRKIMRALPLSESETIEFAQMHASVIQPSSQVANPYQLGLALFEQIESKYGIDGMFQARIIENDASMLRNESTERVITDIFHIPANHTWQDIRDRLVASKTNNGAPTIQVEFGQNATLYLKHAYEGYELDWAEVEKTLPYVHRLWMNPIQLTTVLEGRAVTFTYDGIRTHKQFS